MEYDKQDLYKDLASNIINKNYNKISEISANLNKLGSKSTRKTHSSEDLRRFSS